MANETEAVPEAGFDIEATMQRLAARFVRVSLMWDANNRRFVAAVRYARANERGTGRTAREAFADLERKVPPAPQGP